MMIFINEPNEAVRSFIIIKCFEQLNLEWLIRAGGGPGPSHRRRRWEKGVALPPPLTPQTNKSPENIFRPNIIYNLGIFGQMS